MASLDNVLLQLREERDQTQSEIEKLQSAISTIEDLVGRVSGDNGARPRKKMSAAGRRRIAQAQRARWAKLRKPPQPAVTAKSIAPTPAKRRLSPAGRRRIIAAAKARWARVRAQQNKKAA